MGGIFQSGDSMLPMLRSAFAMLTCCAFLNSAEVSVKKTLNLGVIKAMVAAAEAEAATRKVEVTLCIVDESGNLLYLQKGDGASINTIAFAEKKARHAAAYGSPSKNAADAVKNGNVAALSFPNYFPNQGGLPIKIEGKTIGGISASGAASEIDEAIAQAGLNALPK